MNLDSMLKGIRYSTSPPFLPVRLFVVSLNRDILKSIRKTAPLYT